MGAQPIEACAERGVDEDPKRHDYNLESQKHPETALPLLDDCMVLMGTPIPGPMNGTMLPLETQLDISAKQSESEAQAKKEAEEQAQTEAEEQAKMNAKIQAKNKAEAEAEAQAKKVAEKQAQKEAEEARKEV